MTFARSLNSDGKYGLGLLLAIAVLLLPLAGGDALRLWGRYERSAIAGGDWWRWITAHFVHLGSSHALLNATGLALLWALFARSYRLGQWLAAAAYTIFCIDIGFWFFSPQLEWYVGASALLHGVFACGCVAMIKSKDRVAFIAAPLFAAKLAWEQFHGALPFEDLGQVVTISHLYGAIGGAVAGMVLRPQVEPVYSSV
jgi:rhomboid family GlyGly-CTERM serine protease